jgi:hypothetical protein
VLLDADLKVRTTIRNRIDVTTINAELAELADPLGFLRARRFLR